MLYYLLEFLDKNFDFPGSGLYRYISFRASIAMLLSLIIAMIYGKRIILFLQKKQLGETVRDLGLIGQNEKAGTPTMGGIIIILSTLIPVLLIARLTNVYIIILLITTIWMGLIGFADDYIKVFLKDKKGLAGKFKVLGQVTLGIVVGSILYWNNNVTVRLKDTSNKAFTEQVQKNERKMPHYQTMIKSTVSTVPLFKNNEWNYSEFLFWMNKKQANHWAWIIFIPFVILIITAVSNGANLTDGIDGLAAGSSSIIVLTLALFAWVSGNIILADYLNIMFIPNSGEVVIFTTAFAGALIGFLWYNTYPAQVFMGDTGSLTIGGIIAVVALILRKELLIPVLCGIFFIENLSVVMQVSYFKYTKKKYGEGRRIFLMAPLHHHFQKQGYHESKIVTRFLIVSLILAIVTIITLKVR